MRKSVGVALIAVFGALVLPMTVAGAQEDPGAPPTPACVITSFSPTAPQSEAAFKAGVPVTLAGTTDSPVTLSLFAAPGATPPGPTGPPALIAEKAVAAGSWEISGVVSGPSTITLGITYGEDNAYAAACADRFGINVFSVNAEAASIGDPGDPGALAFTGSSDTPSYVLIGIAAVVVGTVLVVAARRRKQVS